MILESLYYFGYYLSLFILPFIVYILFIRDNDGRSFYSNRDIFYYIKLYAAKREVEKYQAKYRKHVETLDPHLEYGFSMTTDMHTNVQCINGVDERGNSLILQITLAKGNICESYLCLRLADGNTYVFPGKNHVIQNNQTKPQWKVNGLEIEILEPFRRLRITFNGLLQNISKTDKDVIEHIKFNFIFNSAASPFHIPHDVDKMLLAQAVATDPWRDGTWRHNLVDQSGFHQVGVLKGFLKGDSYTSEYELNLATNRSRVYAIDDRVLLDRAVKILMVDAFGNLINIVIKSFTDGCSQMNMGYIFTSENRLLPLKGTDIKLSCLAQYKILPEVLVCQVDTSGKTFKCVLHFNKSKALEFINDIKYHGFTCFNVPAECEMNNHQGTAVVDFWYKSEGTEMFIPQRLLKSKSAVRHVLVSDLRSEESHELEATGGKGNSLALMMSLKSNDMIIPDGFVVTVNAYKLQLSSNTDLTESITLLNEICCGKKEGNLEAACQETVKLFKETKMNEKVRESILNQLHVYDHDMVKGWAARSSAIGEDSEELSAAGQNETFLGLQSPEQILEAVQCCWASLFTYQSVHYRWQHGLAVAADMAVVVQQLVPADCAGVMFTCHPSTLNPAQMVITSNFGLGETVVSGESEPDTYIVTRTWRDELSISSRQLGMKNKVMKMSSDGIKAISFENSKDNSSLTDDQILKLAHIGIRLEKAFGNPRDIEWAYHNNKLYLLQSRPITTLNTWTDYELSHELDFPMLSDNNVLTVANIREVIPNAATVLSQTSTIDATDKSVQIFAQMNYDPKSTKGLIYYKHNVFIDVVNSIHKNVGKQVRVSSLILDLAIFGHPVLDEKLNNLIMNRRGTISSLSALLELIRILKAAWNNRSTLELSRRTARGIDLKITKHEPLLVNYRKIDQALKDLLVVALCHSKVTSVSVLYQVIAMNVLLEGKNELTTEHYADFAMVLSSCEDVISAEIPQYLARIASIIRSKSNYGEFSTILPDRGVQWLKENCLEAYQLLQEFLAKHGHRNLGEFEIMEDSWGRNPSKLMPMLQANVKHETSSNKIKETVDDIVKKLKTPTSSMTRSIVRYFMNKIRVAVGVRENSKSEFVRAMNQIRVAYKELSQQMVLEGILPSKDLIFHLTHYEIGQVIKGMHPSLISKAVRRKRLYPQWNKLKFSEVVYGAPKLGDDNKDILIEKFENVCKGTPVCTGIAKGRACVINSLDEIGLLETGDILITYSTDIGWSPYFPMISGLVTELGGLVSHGAVVAREYGLPCIVGIKNATKHFKTGDTVLLDGNLGEIGKI